MVHALWKDFLEKEECKFHLVQFHYMSCYLCAFYEGKIICKMAYYTYQNESIDAPKSNRSHT